MDDEIKLLAHLIKEQNLLLNEISSIIGRPASIGSVGEYLASKVFNIDLEKSAVAKGIDGHFNQDNLSGKTVNIKWYGKWESLLDITPNSLPDYYLVMAGPKSGVESSRGKIRPWLINYVFLFNSQELVSELRTIGVKIGIATSVRSYLWERAMIYPEQRNIDYILSAEQIGILNLFDNSFNQ